MKGKIKSCNIRQQNHFSFIFVIMVSFLQLKRHESKCILLLYEYSPLIILRNNERTKNFPISIPIRFISCSEAAESRWKTRCTINQQLQNSLAVHSQEPTQVRARLTFRPVNYIIQTVSRVFFPAVKTSLIAIFPTFLLSHLQEPTID